MIFWYTVSGKWCNQTLTPEYIHHSNNIKILFCTAAISTLNLLKQREVWAAAPSVVLGCSAVLAAVVSSLLPETKRMPLYDTVAALEASSHTR